MPKVWKPKFQATFYTSPLSARKITGNPSYVQQLRVLSYSWIMTKRNRSSPVRKMSKPSPDRKSTRLNSSHGYISYAVFCLKKKKRANHIYNQRFKTKFIDY